MSVDDWMPKVKKDAEVIRALRAERDMLRAEVKRLTDMASRRYHVEMARTGATGYEGRFCIYGPSQSPWPYEAFTTKGDAEARCLELNKEINHD